MVLHQRGHIQREVCEQTGCSGPGVEESEEDQSKRRRNLLKSDASQSFSFERLTGIQRVTGSGSFIEMPSLPSAITRISQMLLVEL